MKNVLNTKLSDDNNNKVNTILANPVKKTSCFSGTGLHSLLYFSGGRYWFATVLPFSVIGTLVQTTQVKKKDTAISSDVVNRFLDAKHVKELKHYIMDNKDNFTIPPITLVTREKLPFAPVVFDDMDQFESMESVYQKAKEIGSLFGVLTIPLGFVFICLDGNHRSKAIAELAIEDPDSIQGNYLLCNIVFETDNIKIRQDFVDINQNAKTTTATINTLFNTRDPLSKLTSETIDSTDYLNENTELLSASVSKNSKKLYTLNNIKNAIVELGTYNSQSRASINKMSTELGNNPEYLGGLSLEIDVFFDSLKKNKIISDFLNAETREEKSTIRSNGVISSGVGLIIAARVVSEAAENSKGLSYNDILSRVMRFDWSRSNNFFKGKILSDEGAIISSTNSINSTANALLKELFPEAAARKENK